MYILQRRLASFDGFAPWAHAPARQVACPGRYGTETGAHGQISQFRREWLRVIDAQGEALMEVDPGLIFKILSHIRRRGERRETGLHYQDGPEDYTYAQVDCYVKRCAEQDLIIRRGVLSRDWVIVSLTQRGWDYLRDEET